MHPLIWIAAGAVSSLGWKWARSRDDEDETPAQEAPVEVLEAPPPGLVRRGALVAAMGFVILGRWGRSAGSRLLPQAAPKELSASEAEAEKKLRKPR